MNTEKKRNKLLPGLTKLGLLAVLVAVPISLIAEPGGDSPEKSRKTLAERLRVDSESHANALRDLIQRAQEGGGMLELEMEEFDQLMGFDSVAGESSEVIRRMMQQRFMDQLGQRLAQAGDEPEAKSMRDFLTELKNRFSGRPSSKNEREHDSILLEYRPVIEEARKSTVALLSGGEQVALGTVVDADGYLVTKASEVQRRDVVCRLADGTEKPAEIVDVYEPLDIALLRVDASGLSAARWADGGTYTPGTFLAAPGMTEDPVAIGVLSVVPRNLSERTKGFLGVLPQGVDGGVRLLEVTKKTPAAKAGLKADDFIISIDGEKMGNTSAFRRAIAGHQPGATLKFRIRRGEEERDVSVTLESRELLVELNGGRAPMDPRSEKMNAMGGELSTNRAGYISAMQTDLTLAPSECGGPLVDLDGKVVGVNIARGGRVKSYAIPSKDLIGLLEDVRSGKFTITDPAELRRVVQQADTAIARAEAALAKARKEKRSAQGALEKAMAKDKQKTQPSER